MEFSIPDNIYINLAMPVVIGVIMFSLINPRVFEMLELTESYQNQLLFFNLFISSFVIIIIRFSMLKTEGKLIVKKSWRDNMTETQKWWARIVEKDLKEKGFEIDDDGHTRRIGDGKP